MSIPSTLPIMSVGFSTSGTPSFSISLLMPGDAFGHDLRMRRTADDHLRPLDPLVLGDALVVHPLGELDDVRGVEIQDAQAYHESLLADE